MRKQPTCAPAADPEQRPLPRKDFSTPQDLVPGLLMAWDFCSTYRQGSNRKPLSLCLGHGLLCLILQCKAHHAWLCRALLRLPPFPLARLELAFVEEPPTCHQPSAVVEQPLGEQALGEPHIACSVALSTRSQSCIYVMHTWWCRSLAKEAC